MPESMRKSQLLFEGQWKEPGARNQNASSQVKITITDVRMAVAKLESIPVTPIFARTAVAAAKTAESSAHISQFT